MLVLVLVLFAAPSFSLEAETQTWGGGPAQEDRLLSAILRSVPMGIGMVEDRVLTSVNDYVLELTGYRREELIGQSARMLYPTQEDYEDVGREKYRQIAEKGSGTVETRWQRKDGTILDVILASTPLDPEDLSAGVTFTVLDITDRKQSEERFAKAFHASPAPLVISDIETGLFIDVNERWNEMLGYSREELIGKTSKEVGIWADPADRDRIVGKIAEQGFFKDEPIRFKTRDGDFRYALWSAEVVLVNGRQVMLSLILDETERRMAEMALGNRTRLFLGFSRKEVSCRVRVDLNQEVQGVSDMLRRTILKMITLETRFAPQLWPLFADPVQIEQALLNLANNSVDAMPEGGVFRIETSNVVLDEAFVRMHPGSTLGTHVLLMVTDTGTGMDRETLAHVFDPFFTTKPVGKGTGLGLASVYGIVKGHDGYIQCYSEPGQGTVFRIYLPTAEELVPEEETQPGSALPEGQGQGEAILVVDDEPEIRELTREALEALGYVVKSVATGEEALEAYRREGQAIDLVLMNLNMPGMGGNKCLQELLRLDPLVKVVIASGYSSEGHGRQSLSAGAKGFLGKPYQLRDLEKVVREVLDK